MNTTSVHGDFKGYGAYPLSESESMVRQRLLKNLHDLQDKNETCLIKAKHQGKEKIFSQILTVKKLINRVIEESDKPRSGSVYRFEKILLSDETAAADIDRHIEKLITECNVIIEALTCSESDMHISERFVRIIANMNEIGRLFHQRMEIFKRMQVYA